LFSDILVVPDALGQPVSFETGEGPRLQPIRSETDFARLFEKIDLDRLGPVFETIDRVKSALPAETTFLGFCGAPWTVASYMIAGQGTPEQAPARMFAYQHPALFQRLIDRLVEASIDYLERQFEGRRSSGPRIRAMVPKARGGDRRGIAAATPERADHRFSAKRHQPSRPLRAVDGGRYGRPGYGGRPGLRARGR
jgi:hypothetical protein